MRASAHIHTHSYIQAHIYKETVTTYNVIKMNIEKENHYLNVTLVVLVYLCVWCVYKV